MHSFCKFMIDRPDKMPQHAEPMYRQLVRLSSNYHTASPVQLLRLQRLVCPVQLASIHFSFKGNLFMIADVFSEFLADWPEP